MGATAVEQWMSNEAIHPFPQFDFYYNTYLAPGKNMKQINEDFEKIKPNWNKKYFLKDDPGLTAQWYLPGTDTSDSKPMKQPSRWYLMQVAKAVCTICSGHLTGQAPGNTKKAAKECSQI